MRTHGEDDRDDHVVLERAFRGKVDESMALARTRRSELASHEKMQYRIASDPHARMLVDDDGSFGPAWAFGPPLLQRNLDAATGPDLNVSAVGTRAIGVGEQRARREETRAWQGTGVESEADVGELPDSGTGAKVGSLQGARRVKDNQREHAGVRGASVRAAAEVAAVS